jgi:hypothetical protein
MSTPPLLSLPNFAIHFQLETDACATGLRAVLMQQGKPLAFFSKSLSPKEKEALAIFEALKKWCHYFLGNKVVIKPDQRSLQYVGSQRLPEGIQHKLMLKLLEFDYEIQCKKVKKNVVADALSRQFHQEEAKIMTNTDQCHNISAVAPTWLEDVTSSYASDEKCLQLLQALAVNKDIHPKFTLQAGILRYNGKIYIGSIIDVRSKIFHAFHSSAFGGHSGHRVTLHKI